MTNVTNLIFDSIANARVCKADFGTDYNMYCAYLSQFVETVEGVKTRIQPVSLEVYNELTTDVYRIVLSSVENSEDTVSCRVVAGSLDDAMGKAHQAAGHWYTDLVSCEIVGELAAV